jgi:hypothetical protein
MNIAQRDQWLADIRGTAEGLAPLFGLSDEEYVTPYMHVAEHVADSSDAALREALMILAGNVAFMVDVHRAVLSGQFVAEQTKGESWNE